MIFTMLVCSQFIIMAQAEEAFNNEVLENTVENTENLTTYEEILDEEVVDEQILEEVEQIPTTSTVLEGKIILLDAGHGEGYNTYKDYSEGDNMYLLTKKIVPLLEAHGATVVELRPGLENYDLSKRSAIANKVSLEFLLEKFVNDRLYYNDYKEEIEQILDLIEKLDKIIDNPSTAGEVFNAPYSTKNDITEELLQIFAFQDDDEIASRFLLLSLHSNASSRTSASGALTFYEVHSQDDGGAYTYFRDYAHIELEKAFSDEILYELELFGFEDTGSRPENFHMMRENNLPALLVENGFHTNDEDREKLTGDENLNKIAEAYCNAILKYFALDIIPDEPKREEYTIIDVINVGNVVKYSDFVYNNTLGNVGGIINNVMNIANKF